MKTLESQNRIKVLMARFAAQVENSIAMGHTDINHVAESMLIPVFKDVYGLPGLKNLNTEAANFPGVDLGDDEKRVAIQVTSTSDAEKVKDTLRKFVNHGLDDRFDRVIVYVLTRKQGSYTGRGFEEIIGGRFEFDTKRDIHDQRDVLELVAELPLAELERVQSILEAEFGAGDTPPHAHKPPKTQTLHLNLLEMSFPKALYVADLRASLRDSTRRSEEEDDREHEQWRSRRRRKRRAKPRDQIRDFLSARDLKFPVDWEYYAGQLLTFHNLEDPDVALSEVIEPETVTEISPEEFYEQSEGHEHIFRSLLRKCLQQKLFHCGVQWQHETNLFIFFPEDEEELRKEGWVGKKKNPPRQVYEVVKKDPDKVKKRKPGQGEASMVLYHKHFAFETQQVRLGDSWYLLIQPNWYFSRDGYNSSFYASKNLAWLKRHETNSHVFNSLRFVAYFLRTIKPPTLFKQKEPYKYLQFGDLVTLPGAPELHDKDWLPGERKDKRRRLEEGEEVAGSLLDFLGTTSLDAKDEDDEE